MVLSNNFVWRIRLRDWYVSCANFSNPNRVNTRPMNTYDAITCGIGFRIGVFDTSIHRTFNISYPMCYFALHPPASPWLFRRYWMNASTYQTCNTTNNSIQQKLIADWPGRRLGPPHPFTVLFTCMEVSLPSWKFVEASIYSIYFQRIKSLPWKFVQASSQVYGNSPFWLTWKLPPTCINWRIHKHIRWKLPRYSICPCGLPPTCTSS